MAAGLGEFQRELVRTRARQRCEYCRLPQKFSELRFHIEHIVPRQHGGDDEPDNLALACPACNLHKGPNLTGVDPATGRLERLYHPRRDRWGDHFSYEGVHLVGKSPAGRTPVRLLEMNGADTLRLRSLLAGIGDLE